MIAFGKAHETEIVERALESIRNLGNYKGPILVITDAPTGRYEIVGDPSLFVHKASINITTTPHEKEKRWDIKKKMAYKRFKMQVLNVLDSIPQLDAVESIIYMDIDILIGQDLSIFESFIAESNRNVQQGIFNEKPHFYMHAFPQPHRKGVVEDFHSGVMVLHRNHSAGCLVAWQGLIDTGTFVRDQPALSHVSRNFDEYHCRLYPIPLDTFMLFPEKEDMEYGLRRTFIHVTNTRRAIKLDHALQEEYFRKTIGVVHTAVGTFD